MAVRGTSVSLQKQMVALYCLPALIITKQLPELRGKGLRNCSSVLVTWSVGQGEQGHGKDLVGEGRRAAVVGGERLDFPRGGMGPPVRGAGGNNNVNTHAYGQCEQDEERRWQWDWRD